MGATLSVEEAPEGLANSRPSARIDALAVVQQWQDAVSLAAASGDVRAGSSEALVFAQERLPGEAVVAHLERFLPWLKSADPWMCSSTRDLFEQKISPQVLAEHFHEIVPPLLADPELRPWSFGFLAARMSPSCLTELIDLIAQQESSWSKEPATLEFVKGQLPQELSAEHADRILGLLVSNDWKVRCWTLNLLNHRVPKTLLSETWEEVLRLLVDPSWPAQAESVETLKLLEARIPSELIAEQFHKFLPHLQNADLRISNASQQLFEIKISEEVLAVHFQKIVPPLLANSLRQPRWLDLLTGRIPTSRLTELIDLIVMLSAEESTFRALEFVKAQLPSELDAEHVNHMLPLTLLGNTVPYVSCWTLHLLCEGASTLHFAQHWDKVLSLLTSPSWAVQLRTLNLLDEKIPDELIATHFHELLPVLHSKDSRTRDSSGRMLEQKVSANILAENFHKIVPPLLADPELLPWSFGFLRGRIVERLVPELVDVIFSILCRQEAAWSGKETAMLEFMEASLPSELTAEHVSHIVAFLAKSDLSVEPRCWTLQFLRERAGTLHFAQHWDKVLALLAIPCYEVQQRTLNLLEEKILDEMIATYFHELLPVLHSKDSRIRDSSRRMLEQKVSANILAENFHKIVPPLLADPELLPWSFGFLRGRIVERLVPELIDVIFNILCRTEAAWSGKETAMLEFMEASLPSELTAEHGNHIVAFLAKSDLKVEPRCWTLQFLCERAGTLHFAQHWDKVLALLAIPCHEVQQRTLNLLEEKSRIRDSSRRMLEQKASADILAENFHKIVPPLLADPELLPWSLGFLRGRIVERLAPELIDVIFNILCRTEAAWSGKEIAMLEFMEASLPSELTAEHGNHIVAFLAKSDLKVEPRCWTLQFLCERAGTLHFAQHWDKVLALLAIPCYGVQQRTLNLLEEKIPDELIAAHFHELLPVLHSKDSRIRDSSRRMLEQKVSADILAEHFHKIVPPLLADPELLPWSFGFLRGRIVERLVPELVDVFNILCRTEAGHLQNFEVVFMDLLEKRLSCLLLAMPRDRIASWRCEEGNTWLHVAAKAGNLEACEALVDQVGLPLREKNKAGDEPRCLSLAWPAIVEALSRGREAHQKHGIFIGNQDLGGNLKSVVGLKTHKMQLTLSEGSLRSGLKMKELHEVAHGTGPYDLASSNCHHAAQKVFNHCCAREEDQELQPPNEWLAKLGGAIRLGGRFNSTRSAGCGPEGSNSDVASVNSEVASGSHPADRPSGFTRSVDLCCDDFAEVAAALSHAVYEEDPAMVLRLAEAGTVSIRNNLSRPVRVFNCSTETRNRVEVNEVLNIAGVTEKFHVDVDAVAWAPGLYPWRKMAERQAVWMGHRYNMSEAFGGEVVLQEVVSVAPKHAVDVLRVTQKSGSNSPVQWLLARSDNGLYVSFRGTYDLQDVVINLGAAPDYNHFKENGIGVHGGIANALEQEGDGICNVVNDVLQACRSTADLERDWSSAAIRSVEVAAVRTFGAPHVLVPPSRPEDRQKLWCTLDSITQHWVHDWDPVPRLPFGKTWLTDVLLNLKVFPGFRRVAQKYIQALQRHYDETRAKLLERYDVVGEVVLVGKATSVALRASEGSAASKELLGEKPPESVMTPNKLLAFHSMEDYLQLGHPPIDSCLIVQKRGPWKSRLSLGDLMPAAAAGETQRHKQDETDHVCSWLKEILQSLRCRDVSARLRALDRLSECLPSELPARHWVKVISLIEDAKNEVSLKALTLMQEKMPSEFIVQHIDRFLSVLKSHSSQQKDLGQNSLSQNPKQMRRVLGQEQVQQQVSQLLQEKIPGELIANQMEKLLPCLKWSTFTRHLFEEKISGEVLATHLQKIVPPLLIHQELHIWSFGFLTVRISQRHVAKLMDLIIGVLARQEGWLEKRRVLEFMKEQMPSELHADHVNRIAALLANTDWQVRHWTVSLLSSRSPGNTLFTEHWHSVLALLADHERTLQLLEQKMPKERITELFANHWQNVIALLASETPEEQQRFLTLLEKLPNDLMAELSSEHGQKSFAHLFDPSLRAQRLGLKLLSGKMPAGLISQHFDQILASVRSSDSEIRCTSRKLLESQISTKILEKDFHKIVPPLLADSELQPWSFGILTGRIPPKYHGDLIELIIVLLRKELPRSRQGEALEFLKAQLPGVLGPEHVIKIATFLNIPKCKAKRWTLDLLLKRMPGGLLFTEHWQKSFAHLFDPCLPVQRLGLGLLSRKLPAGLISQLLASVRSSNSEIRCTSRKLLENQISTEILEKDFHEIVPPLLADSELQSWSFGFLTGRIPPKHHGELVELIIVLLREEQALSRQQEALRFLKAHLPGVLGPEHVKKIAAFLDNSECKVKRGILDLLHERMPGGLLFTKHWDRILPLFDDRDPSVRTAATNLALAKGSTLPREQLAEHSGKLVALLQKTGRLASFDRIFQDLLKNRSPQHEFSSLLSKLPVSSLLRAISNEKLASWRDAEGNTWLHLAAEAGHVEACEALVDQVGLPLRQKNKAGDEPLTLAAIPEVDQLLRSRMHFRDTRFGHGNAFVEMFQDERQVSEVTWYTVPLPGMAGNLGGLHSFLVVTVSGTDQGEKTYVLEKAAGSHAREAHQSHGVFIGNQDLSSNLRSVDGQKKKKQLELGNGSLRSGLKMKELYEKAHSTGKYDLAKSNCHHAVQQVFNHCCAREEAWERQPPNEWLAFLAAKISVFEGSGSDVVSLNSEVNSSSSAAPVGSPRAFTVPLDLRHDAFAEVAAALSYAVYEQDAWSILTQAQPDAVSIHNQMPTPVLVCNHDAQIRSRVEPGKAESIQTGGVRKLLLDVHPVGWFAEWRQPLAKKQPVWKGHSYSICKDFRDDNEVVLKHAVSFAPRQKVYLLHATQASEASDSACQVQWLLARSDSVLYAAFRGMADVQDAAISLGAVPDWRRFQKHDIAVHSGIAHALEQATRNVVTDVLQAVQEHCQPGERLVLCGHSLGGGYAQVMAVHLLSRDVDVAALRTFGAPHVLVPPLDPQESPNLWLKLHSITKHWVHDWDPVPRLPLCKTWLVDVLPKLKKEVMDGVRVGMAQNYIKELQRNYNDIAAPLFERYDVAGEVVLVSKAAGLALHASEEAAPLKERLSEKPPGAIMTLNKLLAYHSMEDYLQVSSAIELLVDQMDVLTVVLMILGGWLAAARARSCGLQLGCVLWMGLAQNMQGQERENFCQWFLQQGLGSLRSAEGIHSKKKDLLADCWDIPNIYGLISEAHNGDLISLWQGPPPSSLLAPHATFRVYPCVGRLRSLPGFGCNGTVAVWLGSCVPLWRRSRRQSLRHQMSGSRARTVHFCHDEEYRQRLDTILRDLVTPEAFITLFDVVQGFSRLGQDVADMASTADGDATSMATAVAGIPGLLAVSVGQACDKQQRRSEWFIILLSQHRYWDKIPIELLKHPDCGALAKGAFEQKVSTRLLHEYFEEIVPPLLGDPELRSWSIVVLDGKISSKWHNRLISLILDLLSSKDPPTRSWASALAFLKKQLRDNLRAEQVQAMMDRIAIKGWTEIEKLVTFFGAGARLPRWALSDARLRALQLLNETMPSQSIAVQTEKFLPWLNSADKQTRASTKHLFEQIISQEVLAEHFQIVPPHLAGRQVQSWSFRFRTERISPERLTELIDLIIVLILKSQESLSSSTKQGLLEFMEEQLPDQLSAPHVHKIATFLDCSELHFQIWTLQLLQKRLPDSEIGILLRHTDHSTLHRTSRLILQKASALSRKQLAEHSRQLAVVLHKTGHLDDFEKIFLDLLNSVLQHDWAELLSKLPVSCLLEVAVEPEDMVAWRDAEGNTWLHLAAKAGHVEGCEALVDQVGLPLREKNKAGEEPLTPASREVDRFLRSRMHFRETRFGFGNAFEAMEQDERQVSEVTWYTVPLPGMTGHCGGLHSFVVVAVSSEADQRTKRYVLEKTGSFGRELHQRHGVFIGNQDLGSNLRSVDGLKVHKQLTLSSCIKYSNTYLALFPGSLRRGLKMKELHEVAHGTGPYDLASSNCHHAAQKVFNHCCAREEDQERQPPNEWLAQLASMFQLGGLFNSTSSGSEGSGSNVASANSEVASGSHPADRPSGFARSVDVRSDVFAEVAAALSLAVYEEDSAIVLRPTEAGAVSIRNNLGRPVILHDHTTQTRLDAAERTCVQTAGADKILVDVYDVECIPGLYSWRRLAQTQPVWSGHAYDLSTDFRGDVVLQELVSFASRQPVDVLHTAQKSGTNSPVQWLLARSCSVLYVAFRGTNNGQDIAIDLGAVPDCHRFKEYGIGVHGGIAHALEQEGDGVCHVVSNVLQALQEHRRPGERLVLCGHSLGGGYAQVMAVHLLSRKVEVAAVRTFGAPHVLVPPCRARQKLWCTLDSIMQHWVHDWDPVPRLPLCKTWLVDVLPKLKQEVVTGLRVGIAQKYIQALQQTFDETNDETKAKLLERYDVVGEVVLVSKATSVALRASEGSAALKGWLGEKPPKSVMTLSKLFAYHRME
ncbi:unnamed protein product, partial [Symbiodinium necroappetens]